MRATIRMLRALMRSDRYHLHLRSSHIDHRLNGKRHPRHQFHAAPFLVKIRHFRLLMQSCADTMPDIVASICASVNEEVIHGIPDKKRVLKEGDIISIDAGENSALPAPHAVLRRHHARHSPARSYIRSPQHNPRWRLKSQTGERSLTAGRLKLYTPMAAHRPS